LKTSEVLDFPKASHRHKGHGGQSGQQSGGHSGEHPGGQVGSSQQLMAGLSIGVAPPLTWRLSREPVPAFRPVQTPSPMSATSANDQSSLLILTLLVKEQGLPDGIS
jgi:hypothetical protein